MLISILLGGKAASISEWLEKAQKVEYTIYPKLRRAKVGESSKGNSAQKDPNSANSNP
jgi:hypothetical protein